MKIIFIPQSKKYLYNKHFLKSLYIRYKMYIKCYKMYMYFYCTIMEEQQEKVLTLSEYLKKYILFSQFSRI